MHSWRNDLLSVGIVSISVVGDISLGGSIKSLGDGVKAGAGAEGNIGMGVGVSVSSIKDSSVSVSRPLGDHSLGHGVQALGDRVLTGAGAEGDTVHIRVSSIGGISGIGETSVAISSIEDSGISLGVSRPLAVVSMISVSVVGDIALGHGVEALSDGVKAGAGPKRNVSIGVGITKATIVGIGSSLSGSKSGNTSLHYKKNQDSDNRVFSRNSPKQLISS